MPSAERGPVVDSTMRTLTLFAAALALLAASRPSSAQLDFDVISFGKIQVDDATLGLGSGWLILVNTGTVPISLTDWQKALHYARFSAPVAGFELKPVFAGPTTLLPGQALGAFDGVLLDQLRLGETFVNAAATQFNLSAPWPNGTTQTLRWSFVLAGRQVSGVTEVEFTSTPTTFGVSGVRTASVPTTASVTSLPSGCTGQLSVRPQALASPFRVAPSSDLPVIGNPCFALDVRVNNVPYVLGMDFAPGTTTVLGCEVKVGLSPAFQRIASPGAIVQRLPIPNDLALVGQHVWLQAAGMSRGGVTTLTNGLELVIGARP